MKTKEIRYVPPSKISYNRWPFYKPDLYTNLPNNIHVDHYWSPIDHRKFEKWSSGKSSRTSSSSDDRITQWFVLDLPVVLQEKRKEKTTDCRKIEISSSNISIISLSKLVQSRKEISIRISDVFWWEDKLLSNSFSLIVRFEFIDRKQNEWRW